MSNIKSQLKLVLSKLVLVKKINHFILDRYKTNFKLDNYVLNYTLYSHYTTNYNKSDEENKHKTCLTCIDVKSL